MKTIGRILTFGGLGFIGARMLYFQHWYEYGACVLIFIGIHLYADDLRN